MIGTSAEPSPNCLLYTVNIEIPFATKLRNMDNEIADTLISGLETFLGHWLSHVYVVKDEDFPSIKLFVGVCWFYLACTPALREMVLNGICNYTDSFLIDYCEAYGETVTTADLGQVSVNCVSD
ncbi:E4-ORFC [Bat mastadenovirus]|uniref:E4-ORFC n=1 Tax=Bat mastadenovirus TaxID=740971 RepID=A0A3G9F1E1_9ADEN|nr:E4-ORFC [Bat mastadenovirus]BBE29326.1 E4-ORFC [Bat mastadenovirus]